MKMQLFSVAFIVSIGLIPDAKPNNETLGDPRGIQEDFLNLFDSISKHDAHETDVYRNVLEQEAIREQQVFDKLKEDLHEKRTDVIERTKFPISLYGTPNGREVRESELQPNQELTDLTLGTTSLEHIRRADLIYVDKTEYVEHILTPMGVFRLLVRPSRFGKSLFLDTIYNFLSGTEVENLFNNTYLETRSRTEKFKVIRFSLQSSTTVADFVTLIDDMVSTYKVNLTNHDGSVINKNVPSYFADVVSRMCHQSEEKQYIALLIDEYDLPLLNTGSEAMIYYVRFLQRLKGLLFTLKLMYVIMTGSSSMSNLYVLNPDNRSSYIYTRELGIEDISTYPNFNEACGFTKEEIRVYYVKHIGEIARMHDRSSEDVLNEMEQWYDGYRFSSGRPQYTVFNPETVMHYLKLRDFEGRSLWGQMGEHPGALVIAHIRDALKDSTARALLDLSRSFTYSELCPDNQCKLPEDIESNLQKRTLESVLFQTGLLTIASHNPLIRGYTLKIPNRDAGMVFQSVTATAMRFYEKYSTYAAQMMASLKNFHLKTLVDLYHKLCTEFHNAQVYIFPTEKKERNHQWQLTTALMIVNECDLYMERDTTTYSNGSGSIDIFMECATYNAMIECKCDENPVLTECMEQVRSYRLPPTTQDTSLPILRICINFWDNKVERVAGEKYHANNTRRETFKEYVLIPKTFKCPICGRGFPTNKRLSGHIGHHTKLQKKLNQTEALRLNQTETLKLNKTNV